jgi:spermidine/putrescine transport system substrate-binding protein
VSEGRGLRASNGGAIHRRALLARVARGGAGAVAAATLAACGIRSRAPVPSERDEPLPPLAKQLRIAQWPLYIDKQTLVSFESRTGIDVTYKEVINDNQAFYAVLRESLAAGEPTGWDLVALSDWVVNKMNRSGYLISLEPTLLPHVRRHLGPEFRDPPYDPDNAHSVPWQGGITGIAYNVDLVDAPPRSIADLWNSRLEGQVGMLTEMVDSMSLALLKLGIAPERATIKDAERAQAELIEQRDAGIVRAYYGNDYLDGLTRGDLSISMAWSGDIFWLSRDKPQFRFVVPDEGGILWATPLEIPVGAEHPRDAHAFLDYVYQPEVAADITEYVGYITPVPEVRDVLLQRAESAPERRARYLRSLARNDLVFPSPEMRSRLHSYKALSAEEERAWEDLFAAVVQG